MHRPSSITQTGKQPGLLDHLSEGMSLLLAVPRLMVVAILVDLSLLLGPRLSSVSVTDRLAGWSGKQEGGSAANVADWLSKVGDWDLSRLMALLIPSVVDGLPRADVFEPYDRGYFESSIVVAIVLGAIFILIGTALFVGFLVMLGQSGQMIRGEAQS